MTTLAQTTRIRDVMTKQAPIAASATLREAAARLERSPVDSLLVLHDDGQLAGVFSERDLVFAAHAKTGGAGHVGDYVNTHYLRAREDDSAEQVLERMSAAHVRRAVVFDGEQNPTGLIAPQRVGPAGSAGRADFILEVDGMRVGASAATPGDSTRESADADGAPRLTVGVTAHGASRLHDVAGHEARLLTNPALDSSGAAREVSRFTIVKVDADSTLVVGAPRRQ